MRESKTIIDKKLSQFTNRADLDLIPLTEIICMLQKLENSFVNLILHAAEDIRKKSNGQGNDSSDSNDKEEKDDNNDEYDSKKRKKIPHKAVGILKEWLLENV